MRIKTVTEPGPGMALKLDLKCYKKTATEQAAWKLTGMELQHKVGYRNKIEVEVHIVEYWKYGCIFPMRGGAYQAIIVWEWFINTADNEMNEDDHGARWHRIFLQMMKSQSLQAYTKKVHHTQPISTQFCWLRELKLSDWIH
jgi:hypothetical protein